MNELSQTSGLIVIAIPGDANADIELDALSNTEIIVLRTAYAYAYAGGAKNLAQMFAYVADYHLRTSFGFAPPEETPDWGFYHPNSQDRTTCAKMDRETFITEHWQGTYGTVGIIFYRADWASGNLAHIDALIFECESQGLNVLPVFVYSLRDCDRLGDLPLVYARAFMRADKSCVDVIISLLSYAASDLTRNDRVVRSSGPSMRADARLDVPLIQGLTTGQSVESWEFSDAGLGPLDAATKIVMPEFDGKISGPLFAFRDPVTSLTQAHSLQTEALVRLACSYVRLRHTPNAKKRVALVMTNFANRQGRVGSAVGLDTPASVISILHARKADGYDVGSIPADGDALMSALLRQGGYDTDTLTDEQLEYASSGYDAKMYANWYAEFPENVRVELRDAWGAAPGNAYRYNDRIYVAGLQLGNVFVMIQPPRGFGDNPLAVYHSGDLVPTHHFLGTYRWLRDEFRADAVVQCGKHGTLEWLPGKALGLSQSCYPTLAQGELPLFYPFIIDDPGEGMQAKRRAHACIIDHLIPPMAKAETYDELAKLQRLLGEYASAERIDPDKAPLVAAAIWQSVLAANLQHDLGVSSPPQGDDFSEFLQHVDGYLCELGDMQIRDGLHVFGTAPTGSRLVGLALALVRLDSPDALGVLHAFSRDLDIDFHAISDPENGGIPYLGLLPSGLITSDRAPTVAMVREALDIRARTIVSELLESENHKDVAGLLLEHNIPNNGEFSRTLHMLLLRIVPDVLRASDEMRNLLAALRGRHIPPGPSGSPTRGMANVLPTGKNFYAVDVRAIPSRFAWTVGVRLGNAILNNAKARDGVYPKSIGITVWGTSNMRTQGDDVAEILWLLGVRPIWHEENGRITGLEVIPLQELGRPRIDVTVRISGFFRDSFPGVISLLDSAVELVANLPELPHGNYVRAATYADEVAKITAGMDQLQARRRARFRVFGNKPGSYGTGILELITDGTWREESDLADSYLASGGFAYGTNTYGEPAPAEFEARLSSTTIAVQNQDNREHDIFDSDTYLQHHGGMVAAIRRLSGSHPTALLGDSSNPETPKARTLDDEAKRVFRSRVVNPKWIEGVRRHGYKGAMEMAATVDYLFGYDATAGVVDDWMYERVAQVYVLDEENRAFLRSCNPWSAREMTERLLEAAARGLWISPNAQTIENLREELLSIDGDLEDRSELTHV